MDVAIEELLTQAGVSRARACALVGRSRASHYRAKNPAPASVPKPQPKPQPRALREDERAAVLGALHSDRFIDSAPAEVYATLLDEGIYLASVSTMYRLLHSVGQVRERRAHSVHPASVKPELVAHGPNHVWSWDITKLHGPAKWTYFYLYVILDIYSRYVVGWMLARMSGRPWPSCSSTTR